MCIRLSGTYCGMLREDFAWKRSHHRPGGVMARSGLSASLIRAAAQHAERIYRHIISRGFKRSAGVNPHDYLTQKRVAISVSCSASRRDSCAGHNISNSSL
jgi:hypothetical protein